MLAEQSSNLLRQFNPEYEICFWNYFEDTNFNENLEVVNYLTNQSIKPLELQRAQCHYIFYENYKKNMIFVLFSDPKEVNVNHFVPSIRGNKSEAKKFLGLNTSKLSEEILSQLDIRNIKSLN